MRYLRLMTFNVQLLPVIPLISPSPGDEAEVRASLIVDAFNALPVEELPDVVTFNEVFNEDAREILIKGMSTLYPNHIAKFDDWFIGGDSGLAIYSKYPFVQLPGPGPEKFRFFSYTDHIDDDKFAGKGVAVVQIECPLGIVTIAFTHTQAFYHFEDEYREIRAKQIVDVGNTIAGVCGNFPAPLWAKSIVMGDLNIIGNVPPGIGLIPEPEWNATFQHSSHLLSDLFFDGWRNFQTPPDFAQELDPGFTNNNLEKGKNDHLPQGLLSRLDYICTSKLMTDQRLVVQHMRTRFRTLSDHWSLEADIHMETPHCSPSTALKAEKITPLFSTMRMALLEIQRPGAYQWVFVKSPGTYTIFPAIGFEVTLYAANNLSISWNPYDHIKASEFDIPEMQPLFHRFPNVDEVGIQYAIPGPFFIRVRAGAANPDLQGNCTVGIFTHTGQNQALAIVLDPWALPLDPALPAGNNNGNLDECWFRANIGQAYSGEAHESTFLIQNNTGKTTEIELYAGGFSPLAAVKNDDPETTFTYTTTGPEAVFLLIKRPSFNETKYLAAWKSGLTYLRSEPNIRPMVLRCIDETGPDWAGADEIMLTLYADDKRPEFYQEYWDDADANEILKLEGKVPEIAFVKYIDVSVVEQDFIQSDADSTRILCLADSDPMNKEIVQSFDVQSGSYSFECMISRTQQG